MLFGAHSLQLNNKPWYYMVPSAFPYFGLHNDGGEADYPAREEKRPQTFLFKINSEIDSLSTDQREIKL